MRKEYKNQNIKQMINFRLFLKKFKNKVKKKQSNVYLQSTVQKHLDQIDKMKTVEHLYSMFLIFTEIFEFLSNQIDSQIQF